MPASTGPYPGSRWTPVIEATEDEYLLVACMEVLPDNKQSLLNKVAIFKRANDWAYVDIALSITAGFNSAHEALGHLIATWAAMTSSSS